MVDAVRSARAEYGKPRDVTNFTAEQLLNLRYEYTPEITGMFRECTDKEERKYVSLFLRDRDEKTVQKKWSRVRGISSNSEEDVSKDLEERT